MPTADCNDSGVVVSPVDVSPPKPLYAHPHGRRIIPPSIKGHGRLIVAHRTVPYWGGVMIVIGCFAWAVVCAVYISALLGA
jgi:hypothetical protein